jgi:hypothetical protein
MSADEALLEKVAKAAARAKLEFILVGNAAAALHDVPVMTQDVDLFVRHTPRNLSKIRAFAALLGADITQPYEPPSRVMRLIGRETDVPVDLVFQLSARQKFKSVRSRAVAIRVGWEITKLASLPDIIAAKEAADRPKDRAVLTILKDTLRTKEALNKESR